MKVINGVKLFTKKEVAELLGVTETTIINYRKKGLASTTIGRRIYISEDALTAYLNGETKPQPSNWKLVNK